MEEREGGGGGGVATVWIQGAHSAEPPGGGKVANAFQRQRVRTLVRNLAAQGFRVLGTEWVLGV
eukprot:802508-Pyramimonas_sp.AAC.1